MLNEVIAQYTGKSAEEIGGLTSTSPEEIHKLDNYKAMISALDTEVLSQTMVKARQYMDKNLPDLVIHY